MILQWGIANNIVASTNTQSQQKQINFNISFLTKCIIAMPFIINYTKQTTFELITPQVGTLNISGFGVYLDTYGSINTTVDIIWLSLGN